MKFCIATLPVLQLLEFLDFFFFFFLTIWCFIKVEFVNLEMVLKITTVQQMLLNKS